MAWDRAVALSRLGHKVTNFAARGSAKPPNGKLFETTDARQNFQDEEIAYQMYKDHLEEYDIILDDSHSKYPYLKKAELIQQGEDLPIIGVLHTHPTYSTPPSLPDGTRMKSNFVAVSKNHALEYMGRLGIVIKVAYNGIDVNKYKFQKEKGERFLWVGRWERFKGLHAAIYLCKSLGLPLDVVGKHSDTEPAYFQEMMREIQTSNGLIRYCGEVDEPTLIKYYQNAKALIMVTLWNEPLGLCQLESQSCGTPVVTTTMGPMSETVVHGETGFLCGGTEEMAEALARVEEISPEKCRAWVEKNFSREKMAKSYQDLIYKVINGEVW